MTHTKPDTKPDTNPNTKPYTNDDVTTIILAGGLGRRLNGKNKGLVSLQGKHLIEHVIDRLKSQTSNIVINANKDLDRYKKWNYLMVKDIFPDNQGPLAGILSCRAHISTPLILTVPCDTPLLPKNLLTTMLNAYQKNKTQQLCVAHDGKRLQNLFMLFHVDLFCALDVFFSNKQRKVNDWIHNQGYTQVDFTTQSSQFININTQDTLNLVEKELINAKQKKHE